jgi:[Skp1-protein]-hydroxyproline N-acetylglucosaminyltransferase
MLHINSDTDQRDATNATIFVSIPSYRDPECLATIRNLFITSTFPTRVFVGVVSQYCNNDAKSTIKPDFELSIEDEIAHSNGGDTTLKSDAMESVHFNSWWVSNVRLAFVPAPQATGPCFARHLAEGLWRREQYFMQIDSHMRFRPNWDVYLCALHRSITSKYGSSRPVITAYPMGYSLPNNVPQDIRPTLLVSRYYVFLVYIVCVNSIYVFSYLIVSTRTACCDSGGI